MIVFRMMLVALWAALLIYTSVVIGRHGLNLFAVFFGDIGKLAWPGQFNFDFMCFLTLSGLWTAWRNGFSAIGLLLGIVALFGGAIFLLPYLLILSITAKGNMREVLLGRQAAA